MAGEWLPMRLDLDEDPAVIRICGVTGLDEFQVVGRLHKLWSWANRHSTDGVVLGVTTAWLDRLVDAPGFCAALAAVNWLAVDAERVVFPHFDRHMSNSAKARLDAAQRQRECRARKAAGIAAIPRPTRRAVVARDASRCVYCGRGPGLLDPVTGRHVTVTIDHVTPTSDGGTNDQENLAVACQECNNEKNGRSPEAWGILPQHLQPGLVYDRGRILVMSRIGHGPVTPSRDKNVTTEQNRTGNQGETPPNPPVGGEGGVPDGGGESAKKAKKARPAPKPREPDPLFEALAAATGADRKTAAGHVAKVAHNLRKAEPPYTPADVAEFASRVGDFLPWAKDGYLPTLNQVEQHIGRLRSHADPGGRGPGAGRVPGRVYAGDAAAPTAAGPPPPDPAPAPAADPPGHGADARRGGPPGPGGDPELAGVW